MKFEIKNWISSAVIFTAEIEATENQSLSIKMGLAVRAAYKVGTNLQGAYLQGADLQGADLQGTNLRGANLQGAYLQGANLRGANLQGANLRDAYLRGTYLQGANLQGAYMQGHKLSDVLAPFATLGTPDDWAAFTYLTDRNVQRVVVGCRDFTLAEGREYWAGKENRREVLAVLDYAEAVARIRGWTNIKKKAVAE